MNTQRIAVLAMRIFGLFVAFEGLKRLIQMFEFYFGVEDVTFDFVVGSGAVSSVIVVAFGGLIWFSAEALADRALGQPARAREDIDAEAAEDEVSLNLSGLDAHALAFSALGMYLVVQGLVRGFEALGAWLFTTTLQSEGPAFEVPTFFDGPGGFRTRAVSAGGYLLVGVGLTFGGRTMAAFIRRAWWRSRGVVRARRIEVVDVYDEVRADLSVVDRSDASADVALTLFDDDERPRLRLGTENEEARVTVFDRSGRAVASVPPGGGVPEGTAS